MSISIKINRENYEWLSSLSGELRKELRKPVSINDALSHLKAKKRKIKLSNIAGTWKMSDKDTENFLKDLKKGWKKWNIKSA